MFAIGVGLPEGSPSLYSVLGCIVNSNQVEILSI